MIWLIYLIPSPSSLENVFVYIYSNIVPLLNFVTILSLFFVSLFFLAQESLRAKALGLVLAIVPTTEFLLLLFGGDFNISILPFSLDPSARDLTEFLLVSPLDDLIFIFQLGMLSSVLIAPVLFAIFYRQDTLNMISIIFLNITLWLLALMLGLGVLVITGTRYGGFDLLDLLFSLIYAPYLMFMIYMGRKSIYIAKKS